MIENSKELSNKFQNNKPDHQTKKKKYKKKLKWKHRIKNNIMTLSKNLANFLNMM
jgi:hypothetical protein